MIRGREEDNLVMAFRTSFFLGIGVSEVVALVAIVCTFISAPLGIIVLGAVITLSGFARIAPTQRLFRWCDGRLQAKGKPIRMTGRGVACSPIPRRPLLCEIPRRRLDVPQ
jgi:hypothetical protein